MDFHGITMKGKYYAEQVSSPTGSDTSGRVIVNTSTTANGVSNAFNINKIYWNNGTYWLRPIVANGNDAPDQDNLWDLGQSIVAGDANNYRWRRINSVDFYGRVRYA